MLIFAESQSVDLVEDPPMILQNHRMCRACQFTDPMTVRWCVMHTSPADSFSAKRLLSSAVPSILIHDSMTFETVVSFGVLRWTIRSDAAAE